MMRKTLEECLRMHCGCDVRSTSGIKKIHAFEAFCKKCGASENTHLKMKEIRLKPCLWS